MNALRASWGMSAFVWLGFLVLACVALKTPAIILVMIFLAMPDIALVGGFAEKGRLKPERVRLYNTLHTMTYPIVVLIVGMIVFALTGWVNGGFWPLALAGAAWFVHIAADRAFGFGFRDADGNIIPVGALR